MKIDKKGVPNKRVRGSTCQTLYKNLIFSVVMVNIRYVRHYNPQPNIILPHFEKRFFVFKEILSENSDPKYVWLVLKCEL